CRVGLQGPLVAPESGWADSLRKAHRHGAHLLPYAEVGFALFSPSLSTGPSATAQKTRLTLDPPWSTVFRGESVTLTCSTSHPSGRRFTWYRNHKPFRSTEKNNLRIKYTQEEDAGRYQCKASDSERSDPVQLTISENWLILQVPYYGVFEGDPLCLRCYGWKGAKVSGIRYYRDGVDVTPSHVNSELSIKQARTRDSGKYHCTGSMRTTSYTSIEAQQVQDHPEDSGTPRCQIAAEDPPCDPLPKCWKDPPPLVFVALRQRIPEQKDPLPPNFQ
uniref:Ig-like domain-containing protein n=1 Tax=Chelonoidis abingdonii TaxID=106734 RepID=A0A8C0H221_CHEAB